MRYSPPDRARGPLRHGCRQRRLAVAAAASALTLLVGGCTGGSEPAGDPKGGSRMAVEVQVRLFEFRPGPLQIEPGTTVTWVNEDDILHTVTSGTAGSQGVPGVSDAIPARPDGTFEVELDGAGARAQVTFDRPGSFPYYCDVHFGMAGTVTVQADASD